MIKNSKKVLKYYNKHTTSTKALAPSNISHALGLDYDEVCEIVVYLCEKELLKHYNKHSFISTSKGKDYFKVSYSNLFFKYIYPVITALISFALSMLLK